MALWEADLVQGLSCLCIPLYLIFQNSLREESCKILTPNITYPQAFPMYKDLGYSSTSDIDIFYLLWSNVFSLCKFKYILLPIYDLQRSILEVKESH